MSYGNDEDARQGLAEDDLLDEAEVDTLVREAISLAVGDAPFQHDKINQWTNGIIEGCLKKLAALAKPFKYVVSCNLSQKVGILPAINNVKPLLRILRIPYVHMPSSRGT